MKDTAVIKAWGRFFGQLHKLSKKFGKDHPEVVKRIQRWDQVHCSILSGVKLHPEDAALLEDPEHYGALHGDLNTSNIHYVDGENHLSVYDTDQVQVGFYLFDMAQACFTIVMLDEGGMPITGTPVEGVNPKAFFDAMIEGYESEGFKVDVERLKRMVDIKRQLYVRFAVQAFKEGNIPADMLPFLAYIRDSLVPKWKIEE
jgi:Ser/Thr protein kinase RdoA (MazF antagonist)